MTDFERSGLMNRIRLMLSGMDAHEQLRFLTEYLYFHVYRDPDFQRKYAQEQISAIQEFFDMFR